MRISVFPGDDTLNKLTFHLLTCLHFIYLFTYFCFYLLKSRQFEHDNASWRMSCGLAKGGDTRIALTVVRKTQHI